MGMLFAILIAAVILAAVYYYGVVKPRDQITARDREKMRKMRRERDSRSPSSLPRG